jgi:ribosomal protein S18 acetylase RimI-like enzyme
MRLVTRGDKHFDDIKRISDESFTGMECPNAETLRYHYNCGELFVRMMTHPTLESEIISYVIVTMSGGEPYVWSLATKKEFRGMGIASALLNDVAEWHRLKGDRFLELMVHPDNPAQKLYFDRGFRVIRVVPRYYGAVNGLRMRRVL